MIKNKYKRAIIIISIVVPLTVASLFQIKLDADFSFLPPIYTTINGITILILCLSYYFIKNGDRLNHERMIKTAFVLSCCFLVMYLLYHATSEETKFGGTGMIRNVYFTILISHILLSMVIIPIVFYTYFLAKAEDFVKHKKIAKYTLLLWLYVALSGITVYILLRPYYP